MKWIRTISCACGILLLAASAGCQTIDPNTPLTPVATDEKATEPAPTEPETLEPIQITAASYGMTLSIPSVFCMINEKEMLPGTSYDMGTNGLVAIDRIGRNCVTVSTQNALDFNAFSDLTGEEIIASYARYSFEDISVSSFDSITIGGFPAYRSIATGTLSGTTCYITSIFANLADQENSYSCAITYAITDQVYREEVTASIETLQFSGAPSDSSNDESNSDGGKPEALAYSLPDYQCTVDLPEGWAFLEKNDDHSLKTIPAVAMPKNSETGDNITFGVTKGTVEDSVFASLTSDSYLSIAKEQMEDVSLVDYSSLQIGTYPAHKIVFTGKKDDESLKMTAIYINRSDLNLVYAVALCDKSGDYNAVSNHLEDYIVPISKEA